MSSWAQYGFPEELKFRSPVRPMIGILLALRERVQPRYPEITARGLRLANLETLEQWITPFVFNLSRRSGNLYFPEIITETLSHLTRKNINGHLCCGFWDSTRNPNGAFTLSSTHLQSEGIAQMTFSASTFSPTLSQLRFGPRFSEQFFLSCYRIINAIDSYAMTYEDAEGVKHFYPERIPDLNFSDP